KDIEFELFGAGTYREELMQRARALNLRNLSFPPAVPKKEIARVMSRADAFIYGLHDLPLYRYGMSLNKLSDYLAGGRPIIYYGRSSYDPVSAAGAGFTVPPGDPAAVADAIERLFALSPEERREMGARGQAYLAEHHNIPRLAERLLAVIEPVAAAEARPVRGT